MLYYAYILTIAMVLFIYAGYEGYAVAKGKMSKDERIHKIARHRIVNYSAYVLFMIALVIYFGFESKAISSGEKEAVLKSGFLIPHVISITLSIILLSITLALGFIKRKVLFKNGVKKAGIVHIVLGSLGIFFYVIAVLSGLAMSIKAGIL